MELDSESVKSYCNRNTYNDLILSPFRIGNSRYVYEGQAVPCYNWLNNLTPADRVYAGYHRWEL